MKTTTQTPIERIAEEAKNIDSLVLIQTLVQIEDKMVNIDRDTLEWKTCWVASSGIQQELEERLGLTEKLDKIMDNKRYDHLSYVQAFLLAIPEDAIDWRRLNDN